MKSVSIQINKDDGIHLQAHRGGTSLNGIGSELTIFFNCLNLFLLQLVSFTVDSDPLQPTGGVDRYPSHETFSRTLSPCAHTTVWLKVSQRVSDKITHAHVITCLSFVVSLLCLLPLSLSLAPLLSLSRSTCSLSCSSTSMWSKPPRNKTTALTHK